MSLSSVGLISRQDKNISWKSNRTSLKHLQVCAAQVPINEVHQVMYSMSVSIRQSINVDLRSPRAGLIVRLHLLFISTLVLVVQILHNHLLLHLVSLKDITKCMPTFLKEQLQQTQMRGSEILHSWPMLSCS